MGKAKKRAGSARRSREISREQACIAADLPALESLRDVPAFEDMGADPSQSRRRSAAARRHRPRLGHEPARDAV